MEQSSAADTHEWVQIPPLIRFERKTMAIAGLSVNLMLSPWRLQIVKFVVGVFIVAGHLGMPISRRFAGWLAGWGGRFVVRGARVVGGRSNAA